MEAEEINASLKLATEKFPGVVFRTKIETKKYLKQCKLVVIGILGAEKSGKSTLMNLMAKYLQCDKNEHDGWLEDLIDKTMNVEGITTNQMLRNDTNLCDDGGLYTWPQPFLLKKQGENNPDNKIAVLLLDLNMTWITPSMQLLMCLLCSTLIYNTTSTDVSQLCRLIDTIRQSSLQFFSEGILYNCNDLLFRQLTIVFRDCSQETSEFEFGEDTSLKYLSEICNPSENQVYDVLNGIPYKNCYLLPNPKQGQINCNGYLKTDAHFSQNLGNLITQTLNFDKLSPKICNDNCMTVETFFSMLDAICGVIIFPLSQELNELYFTRAQADNQMNINEFKSSDTQMHPEHSVQVEGAENIISQKELEANSKMNGRLRVSPQRDSSLINEGAVDTCQSIPNLQTDNMMQIYNICNTEFISVALPISLEMLDHGNSSTKQDEIENKNYPKVIINPFTSQQVQRCRLYERRASKESKHYQHAEKAQTYFEKKFIQEYKEGLKSGSFLNSKVEEFFDKLMKESVNEYVSINPDVRIDELLNAVYKLSDTQKCLNKIQNIQLVQRQYLLEMNKKLQTYNFFSVEQLYKFHTDAAEKSFSLCEEKKTKKILDIGFLILFDEYDKINNEILQFEENNFMVNIIPKFKNFYDIEMINVTKRKITTIQLKMAHEKLTEECKVALQKIYSFRSVKIPFLDTCFEKVDKIFNSSLKIFIQANQSKMETVQAKIQLAIERSWINYIETMNKNIENKIFSQADLTNLHKDCFKNAIGTLKVEIGSIDQTEEPRSHLAVLNVKTQKDLANLTEENNARKEKQELERQEKKKAKKREAAEKMKQLKVEQKFQLSLKNQTSQNQHQNAQTYFQFLPNLKASNETDFLPNIRYEKCENGNETINKPINGPTQNPLTAKHITDSNILYYKNSMAQLISLHYPFTIEMLMNKHDEFIEFFNSHILKSSEESGEAKKDCQAIIDRLEDIFPSYKEVAENDSKNLVHMTKLSIFLSKLFDQDYEKGLKSGSFLTCKGDQFMKDVNIAAVNEYIANTPNASKEELMTIVNRLAIIENCRNKIENLQHLLNGYLCEMNQKIETHTFFNFKELKEFHTAAKAKILPIAMNRSATLERGAEILHIHYVGILSKIKEIEIHVLSQIKTVRSETCFKNTEFSSQLEIIYNSAKLEIKSFSETVNIMQPKSVLKLMDCRIKKRLSDIIQHISFEKFNLINRAVFEKLVDVQEASNKNKSNNTDTFKSRFAQLENIYKDTLQIEMAMKNTYHKPMLQLFSSNVPVQLEMLSEKHKQLIQDATNQMSRICKDKKMKLPEMLEIITPRLEEAYKMYVERAENDLSKCNDTATLVQRLFKDMFPQIYKESLISGEFLDSDPNGIVKQLVDVAVNELEAGPRSIHISKEVANSSSFKLSEANLALKIKSLQNTLKSFVVEINEELKANHFFSIEQLYDIHEQAYQKALQTHNNLEDNNILELGLMILGKLYEAFNEDIIEHESSIFIVTILPRIVNFYDDEMIIVTQKTLNMVEIIEAGEKLKQECLLAIQKACSFKERNIQILYSAIDEINNIFEFRMNSYIENNELKMERMQDDITQCIEKSETIYKETMDSQVEGKVLSLVQLMNLHKDSMFKAIEELRQGISQINENPIGSIQVLQIAMEQHFAKILKQNHYKKTDNVERKEN